MRRNQNWLPSIFNDFFDNEWMERANATAPAINVIENEKDYRIEVAAPGMSKEDFNIKLDEDNNLVISMEKKSENKEENKHNGRYLRREFSYSKFQQTMVLPENAEKEKIEAKVENGVLNIIIPKMSEEAAKKAAEEAAASGTEQPKENKVTKIASGFLGVVVLIALAAGGIFYAFTKQKQKKQAEKEALDPDANYTEDKGDFEIPTEDEPEDTGEEDTEPI